MEEDFHFSALPPEVFGNSTTLCVDNQGPNPSFPILEIIIFPNVFLIVNLLVVFVGVCHVKLSIVPYFYVLNMAIINSLLAVIHLVLVLEQYTGEVGGRYGCALHSYCLAVQPLILFVLTFDRYIVHYHPLCYKWREYRSGSILMGAVWILAALYVLPEFLSPWRREVMERTVNCYLYLDPRTSSILQVVSVVLAAVTLILFLLAAGKNFYASCRRKAPGEGAAVNPNNYFTRPYNDDSTGVVNQMTFLTLSIYLVIRTLSTISETISIPGEGQDQESMSEWLFRETAEILKGYESIIVPGVCFCMATEYRAGLLRWLCCRRPGNSPKIAYKRQSDSQQEIDEEGELFASNSRTELCSVEFQTDRRS